MKFSNEPKVVEREKLHEQKEFLAFLSGHFIPFIKRNESFVPKYLELMIRDTGIITIQTAESSECVKAIENIKRLYGYFKSISNMLNYFEDSLNAYKRRDPNNNEINMVITLSSNLKKELANLLIALEFLDEKTNNAKTKQIISEKSYQIKEATEKVHETLMLIDKMINKESRWLKK